MPPRLPMEYPDHTDPVRRQEHGGMGALDVSSVGEWCSLASNQSGPSAGILVCGMIVQAGLRLVRLILLMLTMEFIFFHGLNPSSHVKAEEQGPERSMGERTQAGGLLQPPRATPPRSPASGLVADPAVIADDAVRTNRLQREWRSLPGKPRERLRSDLVAAGEVAQADAPRLDYEEIQKEDSASRMRTAASGRRLRMLESWQRVIGLQDYNTRVVVVGTSLLGFAAGMIGSFTLLRRRALLGDALSHATLPGIGIAFIISSWVGVSEKSLSVLLIGAACSGILGMGSILLIRSTTRLKEDAALGIVLSVFFGAGVALLGIVQQMKTGHAAGLEAFIYGKTASLVARDAWLIAIFGLACSAVSLLLFKELALLCFDSPFAGSQGFPTLLLDSLLMGLVVVVTIIGLQAVGLVLMIALLVIPAAAARFWAQRMQPMTWVAALLGAGSCWLGAAASALLPRLPSGAMIVLASTGFFVISLLAGPERGLIARWRRRRAVEQRIDRQHLLRALYELCESRSPEVTAEHAVGVPIAFADLLAMRSWTAKRLRQQIERAARQELVVARGDRGIALTAAGFLEASHLVHNHRLWEQYLITHADVAPGKVDRDADRIEHVLDPELIAQLEELLEQRRRSAVVRSPHPISLTPPSSATTTR